MIESVLWILGASLGIVLAAWAAHHLHPSLKATFRSERVLAKAYVTAMVIAIAVHSCAVIAGVLRISARFGVENWNWSSISEATRGDAWTIFTILAGQWALTGLTACLIWGWIASSREYLKEIRGHGEAFAGTHASKVS